MDKQLNEIEQKALDAVNSAVNPHGFKAIHFDSIEGEVWFTLWFMDEAKAKAVSHGGFFEACYYTKPKNGKEAGYIAFGVMDGEWVDLVPDPAKSCEIFDKWSQQKTLEQLIAEAMR